MLSSKAYFMFSYKAIISRHIGLSSHKNFYFSSDGAFIRMFTVILTIKQVK